MKLGNKFSVLLVSIEEMDEDCFQKFRILFDEVSASRSGLSQYN